MSSGKTKENIHLNLAFNPVNNFASNVVESSN